jgi:hypothetical protein
MEAFRQCCRLTVGATLLLACGSRTDPGSLHASSVDDGAAPVDAAAGFDGGPILDSSAPVDSFVPPDSGAGCDASIPDISYVLDAVGVLYRYDPVTATATRLGSPNCGNGNVPWTMTTSREHAYFVYTDWTLYAVDLATLACSPTAFRSGQLGIGDQFGVAVSGTGGVEKLYVYGEANGGSNPILAVSDLSSFVLTKVGDITPSPPAPSFPVNLTADSMGNLYAFSPGGLLQQIDERPGAVLQAVQTGVTTMSTWGQLTYGPEIFLLVDTRAVGYLIASQTQVSEHDIGISAIGAGSFLTCPGR